MTNDTEPKKCESDGLCYTSNPPQNRCKNCRTFWFVNEPAPSCIKYVSIGYLAEVTPPVESAIKWPKETDHTGHLVTIFMDGSPAYCEKCEVCINTTPTSDAEEREAWEKEFDKLFLKWEGYGPSSQFRITALNEQLTNIKSFIKNTMLARKKVWEEAACEKLKKEMAEKIEKMSYPDEVLESNERRRGYDLARGALLFVVNETPI